MSEKDPGTGRLPTNAKRKGRRSVKNSSTSPASIKFRENVRAVLEYRKQGFTFEQIGREMHFGGSYACRLAKWGLDEIITPSVEDYRKLQNARLDDLLSAVYSNAIQGDAEAIGCSLKIIDMASKLNGLFAAQKMEHSGEVKGGTQTIFVISEDDAKL